MSFVRSSVAAAASQVFSKSRLSLPALPGGGGGGAAPVVTVHPQSTSAAEGGSANFSVSYTGTEPVTFQWKKNGNNVGTNSSSLSLTSLPLSDNGAQVTVELTNAYGGPIVSNAATLTVTASSNIRYIRPGATGANNGLNWTDAFTAIPATPQRGFVYYLGNGSLPGRTFSTAASGSQWIEFRKATVADHGTDTGWNSAYAGQFTFTSRLTFSTPYWRVNGATRNEADWFDWNSYGIRVNYSTTTGAGGVQQHINIECPVSNLEISYVYCESRITALVGAERRYVVDADSFGGPINTGQRFSRMGIRGGNQGWFLRSTTGGIVEYCAAYGLMGDGDNHAQIVNLYFGSNNSIVRYNKFHDCYRGVFGVEADGATNLVALASTNGCEVYGNEAYRFSTSDAVVGFNGPQPQSNNKVYNNTFVDGTGWNNGLHFGGGTGNTAYNNIWINCGTVTMSNVTTDHNTYSQSTSRGGTNEILGATTAIFVNFAAKDFRLAAAMAGRALAAPYNIDKKGATRGADGAFDRGAYEFVATPITPSINVNRATGPAPLYVHFDFSGTTTTSGSRAFDQLDYQINFDNGEAGNWAITGLPKGSSSGGWVNATVYETAGTKNPTLTVVDGGSSAQVSTTITVSDPASWWPGTQTIYVDPSATYTNAPAGAELRTTMPTIVSNRRILLARGQSFGSISIPRTVSNLRIQGWGSGNKPRITGNLNVCTGFSSSNTSWAECDDISLIDLDVQGSIIQTGSIRRFLVLRCDRVGSGAGGSTACLEIAGALSAWWAKPESYSNFPNVQNVALNCREIGVFDCNFAGEDTAVAANRVHMTVVGEFGDRCAIHGTDARISYEHTCRLYNAHRMSFRHNWLRGRHTEGNGRHCFKLHSAGLAAYADNWAASNNGKWASSKVCVENNLIGSSGGAVSVHNSQFPISIRPQNAGPDDLEGIEFVMLRGNSIVRGPNHVGDIGQFVGRQLATYSNIVSNGSYGVNNGQTLQVSKDSYGTPGDGKYEQLEGAGWGVGPYYGQFTG